MEIIILPIIIQDIVKVMDQEKIHCYVAPLKKNEEIPENVTLIVLNNQWVTRIKTV